MCCKDCNERAVGCHSVCERYALEIDELAKIKAKRNSDARIHGQLFDCRQDLYWKHWRNHR